MRDDKDTAISSGNDGGGVANYVLGPRFYLEVISGVSDRERQSTFIICDVVGFVLFLLLSLFVMCKIVVGSW